MIDKKIIEKAKDYGYIGLFIDEIENPQKFYELHLNTIKDGPDKIAAMTLIHGFINILSIEIAKRDILLESHNIKMED